MNSVIVEKELSYQIMEAAFEVHRELGPGFFESIYEGAMILELRSIGHNIENQQKINVRYKGEPVGVYILDLVVDNKVILELKAQSEIEPVHKQQALYYIKATGLPLAIVINFGTKSLQSVRVANTKKVL